MLSALLLRGSGISQFYHYPHSVQTCFISPLSVCLKAHASLRLFNTSLAMPSSQPCLQIPNSFSLFTLSPKSWLISFGKYHTSPNHPLLTTLQLDLQYSLSLETRLPLAISQYQTPKAPTTMDSTTRTAMMSIYK